MKNLKMFQAALVLAVLSIVVGCSDQFTSPSQEYVKSSNKAGGTDQGFENSSSKIAPVETDQHVNPLYRTQIRLKPGRVYKFEYANTGLNSFNSVDVSRVIMESQNTDKKIFDPCSGIFVYSYSKRDLSCHSKDFSEKVLFVQNTSSSMLDLDVLLLGTRPKDKNYEASIE